MLIDATAEISDFALTTTTQVIVLKRSLTNETDERIKRMANACTSISNDEIGVRWRLMHLFAFYFNRDSAAFAISTNGFALSGGSVHFLVFFSSTVDNLDSFAFGRE